MNLEPHKEEEIMKMKDLTFEKIQNYDVYNSRADKLGFVTEWVARNKYGNSVAFGNTKAECIADARRYIQIENRKAK